MFQIFFHVEHKFYLEHIQFKTFWLVYFEYSEFRKLHLKKAVVIK